MPEDPETNGLICPTCHSFLDTLEVRICQACGNLFCDQACYDRHLTYGYHLGDDWYDDGITRHLLSPHDYSFMAVPYSSTNAWVPSLEPDQEDHQ